MSASGIKPVKGQEIILSNNSVSSWSTSMETASKFGDYMVQYRLDNFNYLFSCAFTNERLFMLWENEFIMAFKEPVKVKIYSVKKKK
jgi:hypothetical protein